MDIVSVFAVPRLYLTLSCFIVLAPVDLYVACKRVESSLADDDDSNFYFIFMDIILYVKYKR